MPTLGVISPPAIEPFAIGEALLSSYRAIGDSCPDSPAKADYPAPKAFITEPPKFDLAFPTEESGGLALLAFFAGAFFFFVGITNLNLLN